MFFRVLINSLVLLAAYFHLKLILYEGQDAKDHIPRQNFLIFSVTKVPGLKTLRKGQRYRFEQIRPYTVRLFFKFVKFEKDAFSSHSRRLSAFRPHILTSVSYQSYGVQEQLPHEAQRIFHILSPRRFLP